MNKKPAIPPQHQHYPRAHPSPVRPEAAPRPTARSATEYRWSRAVPDGRRFPRGG